MVYSDELVNCEYGRDGIAVIKQLMEERTRRRIVDWMIRRIVLQDVASDEQVSKAYAFPRPPFEIDLMKRLLYPVSLKTGLSLQPSYVYGRIYLRGSSLSKHVDRPECQVTVSVALGHSSNSGGWPIFVEDYEGRSRCVCLTPGDALLMDGIRLPHWREELTEAWQAQLFLHFLANKRGVADVPI